jgi:hypothetical protein
MTTDCSVLFYYYQPEEADEASRHPDVDNIYVQP